jgi:hypothetical protein
MANEKATNLLAAGGDAAKAAPLPGVAVASHLAAAAAAVEEFVARVPVYFDRVDGGFESPSPSGPLGTGGRYSSAWDTPDTLGRAIDAICEFMFEVRAFEVDGGDIRRGMDGAWLVPHSKWSCNPPWTELCLEMIEVGKAIVEKKVEVQVGFQREDLSFKWVSDATMTWAEGVAKWLRRKAAEVRAKAEGSGEPSGDGDSEGSGKVDVEIDEIDFRWLRCGDREYRFTPLQAECIKEMWALSRKGTKSFPASAVLGRIPSGQKKRLPSIFRSKSSPNGLHAAWGTLIQPHKGTSQDGWYQFVFDDDCR